MEQRNDKAVRHGEAHDSSVHRLPSSGRAVRTDTPQKRAAASPPQRKSTAQAKAPPNAKPSSAVPKGRAAQTKQTLPERKKAAAPAARQRGTQPVTRPPAGGTATKQPAKAVKQPVKKQPVKKQPATKQPVKKVKRPLTPEQKARLEARRRAAEQARKKMLKRLGAVLLVFLTYYTVISLVTAALLWINFNSAARTDTRYVAVYSPKKSSESKTEKEKLLAECAASDANIDGSLYISYTALSSLGETGMAGDTSELTVIFRASGDVACFTAFSPCITVNGIPASLSAPVVRKGDEYWLPIEFLQKFMNGVTVADASDSDGVPMCKVMLSEYGGIPSLKNHPDGGTEGISEPEYSPDYTGE